MVFFRLYVLNKGVQIQSIPLSIYIKRCVHENPKHGPLSTSNGKASIKWNEENPNEAKKKKKSEWENKSDSSSVFKGAYTNRAGRDPVCVSAEQTQPAYACLFVMDTVNGRQITAFSWGVFPVLHSAKMNGCAVQWAFKKPVLLESHRAVQGWSRSNPPIPQTL